MARPRKASSTPAVSSGQASYVLERLIKERRVTPAEVNSIVTDMGREIRDLEAQLARLRAATGSTETRTMGHEGIHGAPASKGAVAGSPDGQQRARRQRP